VVHTLQSQDGAITGLAFSPDRSILAAATYQNQLVFWDTSNGQQISSQGIAYWLSNLSYSPDGSLLAGVDLPNFAVHIYDAVTLEEQRTLTWTESASPALYGAFFSPDWKTLAWVARGTVQLMDVATQALGPTLSHEDFVNDAAWSPDGSLISTAAAGTVNGSFSPVVFVWDAQTGELITPLVQPEVVLSIAFSPDGRELASLIAGGNLQLWAVTR
jgi:WD40 repeat protein